MYSVSWPGGISDGLTLPCRKCGQIPDFDYNVTDDFWREVVPRLWKLDVVCLSCLSELAFKSGKSVFGSLERIQFTGVNETIMLKPTFAVLHKKVSARGQEEERR